MLPDRGDTSPSPSGRGTRHSRRGSLLDGGGRFIASLVAAALSGVACAAPPAEAPAAATPKASAEPKESWGPQSPQPKWWDAQTPCPDGAKLVGSPPPAGNTLECVDASGKRHGTSSTWFESGHSGTMTEFKNGVPDGKWMYWVHNHRLVEGQYKMGRRDGPWTYFFATGGGFDAQARYDREAEKEYFVEQYDSGLLVSTKHYRDGKPID